MDAWHMLVVDVSRMVLSKMDGGVGFRKGSLGDFMTRGSVFPKEFFVGMSSTVWNWSVGMFETGL